VLLSRIQKKAAVTLRCRHKCFGDITRISDENFQSLPKTDPAEFVEELRLSSENQPGRAKRNAEKAAG
jgi:hypothetical protein